MSTFDPEELKAAALEIVGKFAPSADCKAGAVAAALLTDAGEIHTGICVDTACSLGFCAEHAAIADMLKHRRSRIVAIVAVDHRGDVLPPCGRCRELIRQVDADNWHTKIVLPRGVIVSLADLLPSPWIGSPKPSATDFAASSPSPSFGKEVTET